MTPNENKTKDKVILAAEYFIWKNKVDPKETGLGKLKLQKLLYYVQAWNLALNGEALFEDNFEAWIHGPAIAKVYHHFKEYDFEDSNIQLEENNFDTFTKTEKELLDEIWRVYGKYDGSYLETLTHNELPWQQARGVMRTTEPSQNIISSEVMREYYAAKIKNT